MFTPCPTRLLLSLVAFLTLAVGTAACLAPGQPIDTGAAGDDDDDGAIDSTFTTGAFEALDKEDCGRAGSCHSSTSILGGIALPGGAFDGTVAQAHAEIMSGGITGPSVDTSNAAASLLLTKGAGVPSHVGGALWDDSDKTYKIVLAWITSGALLN